MQLFEDHEPGALITALAFSADGHLLASGARDGSAFVRDSFGSAHVLQEPGLKPSPVHSLAFRPDGTAILADERGWSLARPAGEKWELFAETLPTTSLALLTADLVAIGTGERNNPTAGAFALYDLRTATRREPMFREAYGVRAVAACPGKLLAAWSTGQRELRVWDVRKQTPVRFALSRTSPAIALAPDGTALVAAQDWAVRLIDLERKTDRAVLMGHKGIVSCVAFSPDGASVATGSWDATVRLWDAATGRERAVFQWPVGKVFSLAFASDGQRLAAGGDRGAVVVWDVE
jgi:WD40 repeat protein